jgi:hypothetical protein
MENITELRKALLKNYEQMSTGKIPIKRGMALTDTAGKILRSIKLELDYNFLMRQRHKIEFLEACISNKPKKS